MAAQSIKLTKWPGLTAQFGTGLAILLVFGLVAGLSVSAHIPQSVAALTAPPDSFSAQRALVHLPSIASQPHPTGSPAQAKVRDYLIQQLTALGLETEIQRSGTLENVVARLRGSDSTGAIVILAHYDSAAGVPGAADNGTGVAVLLETMRALVAGPQPHNDIIALFDDKEETGPFAGSWAFVNEHRWMPDVKIAISLDTAVKGPIMVNSTGEQNGLLVQALARAHNGWAWSSLVGGGRYDNYPFLARGIQALDLEDDYSFWQQHTGRDQIEIVNPASVQQMGDQILAVTRELAALDISQPWAEHETFFFVPLVGLVHYPESWALPLAVLAVILLVAAFALAGWRRLVTGRALLVSLGVVFGTIVLIALIVNGLWSQLPGLLSWQTGIWPEWPQVIPPNGAYVLVGFSLLTLIITVAAYGFNRRFGQPTDISLVALIPFALLAVVFAFAEPFRAFVPTWPLLIGSLAWVASLALLKRASWLAQLPPLITAAALLVHFPAIYFGSYYGNGLKELTLLMTLCALYALALLPALETAFLFLHGNGQSPALPSSAS